MNADGFRIHSDMQLSSVHYLTLTNVRGQQTYAVCLTQFAKHSMSKVTFTCYCCWDKCLFIVTLTMVVILLD